MIILDGLCKCILVSILITTKIHRTTQTWASCQIRKIAGCICARNAGDVFLAKVSDPDMHHDTCVTHVPWCMPGYLTSGFIWSRCRWKHSRRPRRVCNTQFYVSGKRPMPQAPSCPFVVFIARTVVGEMWRPRRVRDLNIRYSLDVVIIRLIVYDTNVTYPFWNLPYTRNLVPQQILWPSQFTQTWLTRARLRCHFDEVHVSCRYPNTLVSFVPHSLLSVAGMLEL